jgi:ABC-type amino acid transport system permease subunit
MGIFSLGAMLAVAVIVIAIMALFGDNALFISGLLQGAWLTLQITAFGCILAVIMATIAALFRLYGAAPLRWLAVTYVESSSSAALPPWCSCSGCSSCCRSSVSRWTRSRSACWALG